MCTGLLASCSGGPCTRRESTRRLAGVVMGLLAPTQPFTRHELIDQDELADVSDVGHAAMTVRLAKSSVSTVEWLEHRLHGWASFVAVPIFAIANAGIAITRELLQHAVGSRVVWGVGLGLLVGMPIGILAATYLVVRLGVGALPDGVTWRDLTATAIVAGLGFTVSLFVAELAFVGPEADDAKIAVLLASVAAGTCGLLAARRSVSLRHDEQPRPREGSGRQLATRTAHGRPGLVPVSRGGRKGQPRCSVVVSDAARGRRPHPGPGCVLAWRNHRRQRAGAAANPARPAAARQVIAQGRRLGTRFTGRRP